MKTLYILVLVLFAFAGFSQAPKKINYQGVVRSPNGRPITDTMSLKFDILQNQSTAIYTEVQTVISNSLGVFSTQIGKNNPTLGSIAGINWNNGPYSLLVSIDTTGGVNYKPLPGQQIVSVPYALYADSAAVPPLSYSGGLLHVGQKTVPISLTGAAPSLSLSGNLLSISGGNTVTLPTTSITGSGGTSVTTNANGYDIKSEDIRAALVPTNSSQVLGLAQVIGSYPNFSVVVAPSITYNNSTGFLTITNQTDPLVLALYPQLASPGYTNVFNITPSPSLNGSTLSIGPSTNTIDLNPIAPWRWNQTTNVVTLATISPTQAVGINNSAPACALDVTGYTKLGANAPLIQTLKMTTTSAVANGQVSLPLPVPQVKIISVTVMLDASSGTATYDWIPPLYTPQTGPAGFQYTWRISQGNIYIENVPSNSFNIANKAVNIYITYEK